jgi:enoyl-CoA hydratase/carnithine racemase
MTSQQLDALFLEARKIIIDMLEVEQPIIAAVNGPATGLGATLALFSDVIFAADNAKLGDPHVRVGVVAGDGGAVIWPWLVGAARAKELLMNGGGAHWFDQPRRTSGSTDGESDGLCDAAGQWSDQSNSLDQSVGQ